MFRTPFLALTGALSLAACGGSGESTSVSKPGPVVSANPFDVFASRSAEHDAARIEKQGQFHTAFTGGEFPTSGNATFEGTWENVLDATGTPTVLLGEATIEADFAARTVSGGVTDFVGQVGGGATGFYSGDVTLSNGAIGKDPAVAGSVQNDLRFDYGGVLTGNGQTVTLSGETDMGKFLKTPITGIEATGNGTADIDGSTVTDQMSVYADRQ